jgi:hypothetical protein
VKEGISLPSEDRPGPGWLPDGSRMTWLNAPSGKKADRLTVRAAEHNVILPAGDRKQEPSETCTIITTLLDHEEAPADQVRGTYLTRWSAAETTIGEDKTTIAGAGEPTSGPVLRSGSPRLPAYPEHPRTAAALRTGAESMAEVPARQRHEDHRHWEPQVTVFAPGFS